MRQAYLTISVIFGFTLIAGCSDDSSSKDDGGTDMNGAMDARPLPDGYEPWPCTEPGKSCNAHDPCAIDPVCGKDLKCYPSGFQLCDDGLDCTEDVCKGMGLCEFVPKENFCALPVRVGGDAPDAGPPTTQIQCFAKDDKDPNDPCSLCDPEDDPKHWTPANGGSCDDGDDCTKDDYCQNGTCKGVYYGQQCQDEYGCTEDKCDGKGGCLGSQLKSDWCLINGECYKDQTKKPDGSCNECDVATSQSAWTVIGNTCTIGGKCYETGDLHPGKCAECDPASSTSEWTVKVSDKCLIANTCKDVSDKDATGCFACDPTSDKYDWTQVPGVCSIGGKCYDPQAVHPQGCAECDPAVNATGWTVTGDNCLINNTCYKPNDKDFTQCSSCVPATDKYTWTPLPGLCKIGNKCFTGNDPHPDGCAKCDPATDPNAWTLNSTTQCLIGGQCYNAGAKDALGCSECSLSAPTEWTKIPGCFNIVIAALNEAHDGKLGGLAGADALCTSQAQAAGFSGTFKAFLSTASQNAKDLLTGTDASGVSVINAKGEKLYDNWNQIFTSSKWANTSLYIYSFAGTKVDENTVSPTWYDAQAWNGSNTDGTFKSGYTCSDWTSNASTEKGGSGELDPTYQAWPGTLSNACNKLLAVLCVQVAP